MGNVNRHRLFGIAIADFFSDLPFVGEKDSPGMKSDTSERISPKSSRSPSRGTNRQFLHFFSKNTPTMPRVKQIVALLFVILVIPVSGFAGNPTRKNQKAKAPVQKPDDIEYRTGNRKSPGPFSEAVRVGKMLYLSGQIGTDDTGALVPGGIKAETKQVMERIKSALERNGSSLDRVVKCTCMLADMSEWGAMNEVYVTYFSPDRLPARSALGANGLARGARVEIECIAVVK